MEEKRKSLGGRRDYELGGPDADSHDAWQAPLPFITYAAGAFSAITFMICHPATIALLRDIESELDMNEALESSFIPSRRTVGILHSRCSALIRIIRQTSSSHGAPFESIMEKSQSQASSLSIAGSARSLRP